MKARKILVSLAALALVAAISIGGTLAYLTSQATVKNTFTVGKVNITLDEAVVDENGKAKEDGSRTTETNNGNSYNLMPNHSYDKDPTVTVKSGSEESYVRLLVTVTFDGKVDESYLKSLNLTEKGNEIVLGYSNKWVRNGAPQISTDETKTVVKYEYRYNTTVAGKDADGKNADVKLDPLFTGIKVPSTWNNADLAKLGGFTIDIVAQAIQADGFDTADLAWAEVK